MLVLDLAGVTLTPASLQELILPLAQRIRGGEYGTVRLVISTTDPGVADFVRYMAQAHQLPLYLSPSPFDLSEGTPIGNLTETESSTLDTIVMLGGQVTASRLAEAEGIRPSAATNRLVNLDREGYLVRQPRGRREGDVYIEPRSATATPMVFQGGNRGSNPLGGTNVHGGFSPPSFVQPAPVGPLWGQSPDQVVERLGRRACGGLPRTRRDQRRYAHGAGGGGPGGKRRRVARRGGRHGRTHALTDQRDESGMGLLMSARRPGLVTARIEVDARRGGAGKG